MMKQFPAHIVAVDGIVLNEKNEILLVKNRLSGSWTLPGGQVETGENLIEALVREIKEESGIDAAVGKLYCVSSNTGINKGFGGYETVPTKVIFGFTCAYLSGEPRSSDETTESRWVAAEAVPEYITVPVMAERVKAYFNFDGDIQYLSYVTQPEFILAMKRTI